MARIRLLAISTAAALALTLAACSGQSGTPAAAPPSSSTSAAISTTTSAPATVTVTTRIPSSSSTSPTSTSEIRDSVVTTSSSSSVDYPYDTTNYVQLNSGLQNYYCDEVFNNFTDTTSCSARQQTFWDATAYYNPSGFDTYAHAVVDAGLFNDNVLITDILAYGLVACDDFIGLGGTKDVIGAGALIYESRPLFKSGQQDIAEQIYTTALASLCVPLDS